VHPKARADNASSDQSIALKAKGRSEAARKASIVKGLKGNISRRPLECIGLIRSTCFHILAKSKASNTPEL
jgi:hypothetical protein